MPPSFTNTGLGQTSGTRTIRTSLAVFFATDARPSSREDVG